MWTYTYKINNTGGEFQKKEIVINNRIIDCDKGLLKDTNGQFEIEIKFRLLTIKSKLKINMIHKEIKKDTTYSPV